MLDPSSPIKQGLHENEELGEFFATFLFLLLCKSFLISIKHTKILVWIYKQYKIQSNKRKTEIVQTNKIKLG